MSPSLFLDGCSITRMRYLPSTVGGKALWLRQGDKVTVLYRAILQCIKREVGGWKKLRALGG